jgi:hypothetical protein
MFRPTVTPDRFERAAEQLMVGRTLSIARVRELNAASAAKSHIEFFLLNYNRVPDTCS